jgi:hypothetical protein
MQSDSPPEPVPASTQGLDLWPYLARNVLREWKAILGCGIAFALLAWLLNFTLSDRYTARMVVAPKTSSMLDESGSSLTRSVGALSTLAKLQGQSGDTMYDQYATLLYSQDLASFLLKDHATIGKIFDLQWQTDRREWQKPGGVIFFIKQGIKAVLGLRPWHPPDTTDVTDYLNKHLSMELDRRTGFTTLSYTYKDPRFSRDFLLEVHTIADNLLRQHLLVMTKQRIDYLNSQLAVTSVADSRLTLTDLMVGESKKMMIARADTTFAVDIVDAPIVPDRPSFPSRLEDILLGFLFGAGVSAGVFALGGPSLRRRLEAMFAKSGMGRFGGLLQRFHSHSD